MRTVWMWFYLSCKRYLRRCSFLVILMLLPAAAFLARRAEVKEGTEIRIAVAVLPASDEYGSQENSLEQLLKDALTDRQERDTSGMFRFYECGSEEEVKAEVAARRAECGYVILDGLRDRLEKKDYKRCIRIYAAPSTVTAELSSEVVFAELVRLYDRELFVSYAAESDVFDEVLQHGISRETIRTQADELYRKWSENESTFRFVYETAGGSGEGRETEKSQDGQSAGAALFPVRGIAAVYIFIVGLYSAAVVASDEKKGLFLAVPYHIRTVCQIMEMAAPVVLSAASGLAAICCADAVLTGRGLQELWAMGSYTAAVIVFSWLMRLICRRAEVIYCLLPVFLIGSLVFCPVFVDISRYLPGLGGVGRIFLPWYYLHMGL